MMERTGEKKHVIVVGGGFAGAYIAKNLEKRFDVTLIDEKDYFEFTPGILRSIVEPAHVTKIQVLHTHYLTCAEIVTGCVHNITKDHVEIDAKKHPYDYLVITSGFRYGLPFKPGDVVISTRANELRKSMKRLGQAKSVLIIGGGLCGIELVGELLDKYRGKNGKSSKQITIVQSKETLIPRNNARCVCYVEKKFRKAGVELVFNEYVEHIEGRKYTTRTGEVLEADIAFLCTGIKPNIEFLRPAFDKYITARNQVMVNEHLQMKDHPHIFAAGDITNMREEKTAQAAEKQAMLLVKNVVRHDKKMPLLSYEPKSRPMLISLGKYNGIFTHKNFMMRGIVPAFLKAFVEWRTMKRYRKRA